MMMVYSKNEIISRLRDILDGIWQLDLCEGENYIHINDDCVTPQQSKAIGKFLKSINNQINPSDKGLFIVCE